MTDEQGLLLPDDSAGLVVGGVPSGLLASALDNYLEGRNEHTRRSYSDRLGQFIEWYRGQQAERPLPFKAQLRRYMGHLRDERGLSPRSVQAHVNTVKGLLREVADLEPTAAVALASLGNVKAPPVRGDVVGERLTGPERTRLLAAPGIDTHKGRRDTAILALLSVCGLRRSEAAALTWSHLAEVDGHKAIKDLMGKKERVRTVYLPPSLWRRIHDWAEMAELDTSPGAPVFVRVRRWNKVMATAITPDAIYALVEVYAVRAGLVDGAGNARVKPHDLRRTAAALYDGPIEALQQLLGHSSVQTTERYVAAGLDLDEQAAALAGVKVP